MTDAAMAERAECVMLNKGEFIAEAISILDDVLNRMESHQSKKNATTKGITLMVMQAWNELIYLFLERVIYGYTASLYRS